MCRENRDAEYNAKDEKVHTESLIRNLLCEGETQTTHGPKMVAAIVF